jgi:Predicted redox protein, regulator of disulfide bond formation
MKVELKQVEGGTFVVKADSNHWVVLDASTNEGGSDAASRPMELVLMGLAGCTAIDVELILKKKRAPIKKLELKVDAERAEEHPKVFKQIHISYIIHGAVNRADAEHAVALSEEKYCSASAMLRRTAEITYDIQILP